MVLAKKKSFSLKYKLFPVITRELIDVISVAHQRAININFSSRAMAFIFSPLFLLVHIIVRFRHFNEYLIKIFLLSIHFFLFTLLLPVCVQCNQRVFFALDWITAWHFPTRQLIWWYRVSTRMSLNISYKCLDWVEILTIHLSTLSSSCHSIDVLRANFWQTLISSHLIVEVAGDVYEQLTSICSTFKKTSSQAFEKENESCL